MQCWKCHENVELIERKLSFRAICEKCGFDLHVCKNCRYFSPGKPNDCSMPNTEYVNDRERFNFCEDFVFSQDTYRKEKPSSHDVGKKLFGEDFHEEKKFIL